MSDSVRPQRRQPTRLPYPWDSPGKNTGVGCHFLLQCMKGKSESEVALSCPTLRDPIVCSLPGSSVHGIFQARGLEWGAIAFSRDFPSSTYIYLGIRENIGEFSSMQLHHMCSSLSTASQDTEHFLHASHLLSSHLFLVPNSCHSLICSLEKFLSFKKYYMNGIIHCITF